MEKGSLRCDANISVRPRRQRRLGTKTELKNMNSFKFLGDGMAAEIARQVGILESGGDVRQETLHYDPASRELHARRSKEEADDYRYFPEPDLVPLAPPRELVDRLARELPELPAARIARFRADHGLSAQDATDLNASPEIAAYFEDVARRVRRCEGRRRLGAEPAVGRRADPGQRPGVADPADLGGHDHQHHRPP